jgi:3-oxoacyl-[acyl-carrier-protein] synthase-3
MVAACRLLLERNELTTGDIRWIVPHQANANLLAQVARGLEFSDHDRVVSVIEDFGNTSSASMGIALDKLRRAGLSKAGDYLLFPAFAAGFTWGAALGRLGFPGAVQQQNRDLARKRFLTRLCGGLHNHW